MLRKPPVKRLFSGMVGLPPEPEIVAEPAQTPPVTVVPPHDADAKPVPRSAITPELRRKIEESLTSKPNTISDPRMTVRIEADTSEGTKLIRIRETGDVDSAVDDAAENIVRKSDKPKRTSNALLKQTTNKQPAYLKSVAQPIVPSTDPEAPYGRDENNRPIVPGRNDQEIAADLVKKPYLAPGDCPHGNDSGNCLLCGTKEINPITTTNNPVVDPELDPELDLTRPTFKFHFYPEILRITRKQLVELFDAVVDTEVETMRLVETQLKDPWHIRNQIANLKKIIAQAEKRLQCIPLLIERSERLILSWSAQVMKRGSLSHGIPARAPEDILDEKTREKYKYGEKKKLKKYQRWKTRLQTTVRETQTKMNELQQRLDNWGSRADDFESVTVTRNREVTFRETFREPEEPINDMSESYAKLRKLGATNTEAYISLLSTDYQMLYKLSQNHPSLRPWRRFENEIVLQAIGFRLIRPTSKEFEAYPRLKKYLNEESENTDVEVEHSEEERRIRKTGGAEIGASIYNFGVDRKGRPRLHGSFDNAVNFGNKNRTTNGATPSDDPSGGWAGHIDSGDYAEDTASE
jgi:hypothetical protein